MSLRWIGALGGLSLTILACANIRPPLGGLADACPPHLKVWRASTDKKGRIRYRIQWNEYLDLSGEALPTLVWVNPAPSDSLPSLWRRIRGKRLLVKVPPPLSEGMLWLGPALRDFTEKNPISPTPLVPDSHAQRLRITPAPSAKNPCWLLVRTPNGIYRFLAQGDSFLVAHMPQSTASAYIFEDLNGNALWDGASEPVWLPSAIDTSLFAVSWARLVLDTFPPRPTKTLPWDSYTLLTFSEPVQAEGAFIPLAENALLATDTALTLYDSLGYAYEWQKPDFTLTDTVPAEPPLFWPWHLNSQSPWIYLSTPDTVIRLDTFLHLRQGQRDYLLPLCQERHRLHLSLMPDLKEVSLVRSTSQAEKLSLEKVPVLLRGDSLKTPTRFRLYPPPILGNSSPFVVSESDTLWLIPGRYRVCPADQPLPRALIDDRWPRLGGSPQATREILVPSSDSIQVFYFAFPEP